MLTNVVSKEDTTYWVTIGNIYMHCTCLDFLKMSSQALGKKGKWVYYKSLLCFVQGGLQRWQVYSRSNLHIQRGHTTTWTCRCCRVWVMFEVLYSIACLRMSLFDNINMHSYDKNQHWTDRIWKYPSLLFNQNIGTLWVIFSLKQYQY